MQHVDPGHVARMTQASDGAELDGVKPDLQGGAMGDEELGHDCV